MLDELIGLPPEQQAERLAFYISQQATRQEALSVIDGLIARTDGVQATELLKLRAEARGARRWEGASVLDDLKDELHAVVGLRDGRYRDLLVELFIGDFPPSAQRDRLRSEEMARLERFCADTLDAATAEAALALLDHLLAAGFSPTGRLDRERARLANLVSDVRNRELIEAARRALTAGDPDRAMAAMMRATVPADDLVQNIRDALDASRKLAEVAVTAANLEVVEWPAVSQADELREAVPALLLRHPSLTARHPELARRCEELGADADRFVRANAEACRSLTDISDFWQSLARWAPERMHFVSADWLTPAWEKSLAEIQEAVDRAETPEALDRVQDDLDKRVGRVGGLPVPLAELRGDLALLWAAWHCMEAREPIGDPETMILKPPAAMTARLISVREGRAAIARLAELVPVEDGDEVEAVLALRHDRILGDEAKAALDALQEARRLRRFENSLAALDADGMRASGNQAEAERLVEKIGRLASLRDEPAFESLEGAQNWWLRWIGPSADTLPPALDRTLIEIERERFRQWRRLIIERLEDAELLPEEAERRAVQLRDAPPAVGCLSSRFLRRASIARVESALSKGLVEEAEKGVAALVETEGPDDGDVARLGLLVAVEKSRNGDPAPHILWENRSDDLSRHLDGEALAGSLADAMSSAWRSGAVETAGRLAGTPIKPSALVGRQGERVGFWRDFLPVALRLLGEESDPADFTVLSALAAGSWTPDKRGEAAAAFGLLATRWKEAGRLDACAWAALVLAGPLPEVARTVSDAPGDFEASIMRAVDEVVKDADAMTGFDPPQFSRLRERTRQLSQAWDKFSALVLQSTMQVPLRPRPERLQKTADMAEELWKAAQGLSELEGSDFREPGARILWNQVWAAIVRLSNADDGRSAAKALKDRVLELEDLFGIANRFDRFKAACWKTVADDALFDADVYAEPLLQLEEMQAMLKRSGMADSPMAGKLWSDCAAELARAEPFLPGMEGEGGMAVESGLRRLADADRALDDTLRLLERLAPLTVVSDPVHIRDLIAALPTNAPAALRSRKRLRAFCRREVMPDLIARHRMMFPPWIAEDAAVK